MVTMPSKHNRYDDRLWGWMIIDKEKHMTSMSVTRAVKRLTKAKKVGHAGTLDPLATGILPVAINQATSLIPELMTFKKEYIFTVAWGVSTDTDDCLGQTIHTNSLRPSAQDINNVLSDFTGYISQTPPRFCAAKINGVPAYQSARKGQEVILSSRTIHIENISIIAHNTDSTTFQVICGTGTYVRSLARDIAEKLGTLGHIKTLHRSWVGPFKKGIKTNVMTNNPYWKQYLISPSAVLSHMPSCVLCPLSVEKLWHGQVITAPEQSPPLTTGRVVCYDEKDNLVGMGLFEAKSIIPVRCFIRSNG
jgi:tRNA pseudouridine(55) synthase